MVIVKYINSLGDVIRYNEESGKWEIKTGPLSNLLVSEGDSYEDVIGDVVMNYKVKV